MQFQPSAKAIVNRKNFHGELTFHWLDLEHRSSISLLRLLVNFSDWRRIQISHGDLQNAKKRGLSKWYDTARDKPSKKARLPKWVVLRPHHNFSKSQLFRCREWPIFLSAITKNPAKKAQINFFKGWGRIGSLGKISQREKKRKIIWFQNRKLFKIESCQRGTNHTFAWLCTSFKQNILFTVWDGRLFPDWKCWVKNLRGHLLA